MKSVTSVKDRLKNQSKETGKTLQELYTVYGLERTIYRLSISKYKDNFTLKGGIFLYAVFEGNYARATTDIDFLAQKISNEIGDVRTIFEEIARTRRGYNWSSFVFRSKSYVQIFSVTTPCYTK